MIDKDLLEKYYLTCKCCGRKNHRTKYYDKYNTILCDSCYTMYKKYPYDHIPPKGEIHYDKKGNIICHECGRCFKKLAGHIKDKHNLTTYDYKEKHGLNRTAKLTGKNFVPNISVDITTVSRKFQKGHTASKKTKRLQTIKNRTNIKYNKRQSNEQKGENIKCLD